jgi:hypothetical protein
VRAHVCGQTSNSAERLVADCAHSYAFVAVEVRVAMPSFSKVLQTNFAHIPAILELDIFLRSHFLNYFFVKHGFRTTATIKHGMLLDSLGQVIIALWPDNNCNNLPW